MMFPVTASQFDLVYNGLSFSTASMMASTIFFWLRLSSVDEKYKTALTVGAATLCSDREAACTPRPRSRRSLPTAAPPPLQITGLVTFIAFYHYIRIFNSWVDAYEFPASPDGEIGDPVITGKPFNDACARS